jgi:RNA polymerase sigma-70 factor (ECF subfamily)
MATGEDRPPKAEWERLVDLLGPIHARMAGMARRLAGSAADGDDLFQEAVLRALRALPSLRDPSRFAPWFAAILLSMHRNRTRRSFWKRFLSLDAEGPTWSEPIGADGSAWQTEREQAERMSRALARLPAVQREAVVLFEIEGFGIEEIAAMQRVSPSAVKSRLARGRTRLRRIYSSWGLGRGAKSGNGAAETPRVHSPQRSAAWESAGSGRIVREGKRHE